MAGLFLIKDFQTFNNDTTNPFLNVYGFRSNLAVIDELNALANAWIAHILPAAIAIQSNAMDHQYIEVYELNTVNFITRTLTTDRTGLRTGGYDAKFLAFGYRLNRNTLGTRSGAKRIGCVADGDVVSGAPSSGVTSAVLDFATAYGAPLPVGLIQTWFPVILHRPVSPSTTWTDSPSNGASFTTVTTQNTRKH